MKFRALDLFQPDKASAELHWVGESLLTAKLSSEMKPVGRNIWNALVLNVSCRMKWGRIELEFVTSEESVPKSLKYRHLAFVISPGKSESMLLGMKAEEFFI